MKIPFFGKTEDRQADYTDAVVKAIMSAASGDVVSGQTAGMEIASGWWQRAFASADMTPGAVADMLKPHLGYIGRALVRHGEAVFAIDNLRLIPATTVTVEGGPNPESWSYQLTLAGPSEYTTRTLPANRVLHLVYAIEASSPWRGVSPIEAAGTTRKLLDNLELRLAQETGEGVGNLIPVPNLSAAGQLQADIQALKGKTVLVESTAANWGSGSSGGAPTGDFQSRRVGANPPEGLVRLRREVEESLLGACGIPTTVLDASAAAAARETFRQFLHLTISPIARHIAGQIQAAFEMDTFEITFDRLMASDLSGRARAMQSMVAAGVEVDKAMALSGLMEAE